MPTCGRADRHGRRSLSSYRAADGDANGAEPADWSSTAVSGGGGRSAHRPRELAGRSVLISAATACRRPRAPSSASCACERTVSIGLAAGRTFVGVQLALAAATIRKAGANPSL
jgi:hypothetical protein